MITATQARQYLDQALGVSVPPYIVTAACDSVETAEPAMVAAGYSEATQILVQSMAVAIIAAGGAPRRIASQGAPSGASRSFKNDENALRDLRRTLKNLDTAGTVALLVGPDPSANTMFMVVC